MGKTNIYAKARCNIKNNIKILRNAFLFVLMITILAFGEMFFTTQAFKYSDSMQFAETTYFISKLISSLIKSQLMLGFIYMLVKGKYKFKRFFSFFSLKYWKFNLLMFCLMILPSQICLLVVRKRMYIDITTCFFELIYVIISIVFFTVLYFKADDTKSAFKEQISNTLNFIKRFFLKISVFNLRFIPWCVIYVILYHIAYNVIYPDSLVMIFNQSLFGIGIYLFPYYILSFHNFVLENTIMRENKTLEIASNLISQIQKKLGNKVRDFLISDVCDDKNKQSFSTRFTAYNYFIIKLKYENQNIFCYILFGDYSIELELSSQKWSISDIDLFLDELQYELELRIPDKFLKKNGWIDDQSESHKA